MRFGPYFAMLNAEYEHKAGKIVTESYRDSGGVWTGPGGLITNADGTPVKPGQSWSEADALRIYADAQSEWAAKIWKLIDPAVRAQIKQHQFDALGVLAWNIGIDALSRSTALKKFNEGRFEEAAQAFLLWRFDRLHGGQPGPDGQPARDPNGVVMAEGVSWLKAFRGLYRRSVSAAILSMGYNWRDAAASNRIILNSYPEWIDENREWRDRITNKSEWQDILDDARDDPLPVIKGASPMIEDRQADPLQGIPANLRPFMPADYASLGEDQKSAALNRAMEQAIGGNPATPGPDAIAAARVVGKPGTKPLSANTKRVEEVPYGVKDPKEVGVQPMEDSGRAKALVVQEKSKEGLGAGAALTGGAAAVGSASTITDYFANYDMKFILIALFSVGLGMILFNAIRWWHGRNKRFKAEQEAQQLLY